MNSLDDGDGDIPPMTLCFTPTQRLQVPKLREWFPMFESTFQAKGDIRIDQICLHTAPACGDSSVCVLSCGDATIEEFGLLFAYLANGGGFHSSHFPRSPKRQRIQKSPHDQLRKGLRDFLARNPRFSASRLQRVAARLGLPQEQVDAFEAELLEVAGPWSLFSLEVTIRTGRSGLEIISRVEEGLKILRANGVPWVQQARFACVLGRGTDLAAGSTPLSLATVAETLGMPHATLLLLKSSEAVIAGGATMALDPLSTRKEVPRSSSSSSGGSSTSASPTTNTKPRDVDIFVFTADPTFWRALMDSLSEFKIQPLQHPGLVVLAAPPNRPDLCARVELIHVPNLSPLSLVQAFDLAASSAWFALDDTEGKDEKTTGYLSRTWGCVLDRGTRVMQNHTTGVITRPQRVLKYLDKGFRPTKRLKEYLETHQDRLDGLSASSPGSPPSPSSPSVTHSWRDLMQHIQKPIVFVRAPTESATHGETEYRAVEFHAAGSLTVDEALHTDHEVFLDLELIEFLSPRGVPRVGMDRGPKLSTNPMIILPFGFFPLFAHGGYDFRPEHAYAMPFEILDPVAAKKVHLLERTFIALYRGYPAFQLPPPWEELKAIRPEDKPTKETLKFWRSVQYRGGHGRGGSSTSSKPWVRPNPRMKYDACSVTMDLRSPEIRVFEKGLRVPTGDNIEQTYGVGYAFQVLATPFAIRQSGRVVWKPFVVHRVGEPQSCWSDPASGPNVQSIVD